MSALTNLYVAATSGSDGTGNGTSGNPYKTTQFALNNFGRDTTNGNYINLSGVDVLSGSLTIGTWGVSATGAPTVLRNWAGGPDGQGDLNGNNGNFTIANSLAYWSFENVILRNTGSATIVTLGMDGSLVGCELHTSTNAIAIQTTQYGHNLILGCNIYNCSGRLNLRDENTASYNYFLTGPTNNFSFALLLEGNETSFADHNIITVTGGNYAIYTTGAAMVIANNSILSSGGTTPGIFLDSVGNSGSQIFNNIIEGFSGSGGIGIDPSGGNTGLIYHNAVYNCATAYASGDINMSNDNETLGASPFAKSGSNTFANRKVYFAPVNTGNVWGGAYPDIGLDKGAIQHAGGGAAPPNFNIIPQSA